MQWVLWCIKMAMNLLDIAILNTLGIVVLLLELKVEHYETHIFIATYKNGQKIITFGKVKIEKRSFHYHKDPVCSKDVDSDKTLLSKRCFF